MPSVPRSKPRPCFTVGGRPYVSAGLIPFTIVEGQYYYLLSFRSDKAHLEDLGGKSEPGDPSLPDIALREYREETMGTNAPKLTKDDLTCIAPVPDSKYMAYLAEITDVNVNDSLGVCYESGIERVLIWLTRDQALTYKLNPRTHMIMQQLS